VYTLSLWCFFLSQQQQQQQQQQSTPTSEGCHVGVWYLPPHNIYPRGTRYYNNNNKNNNNKNILLSRVCRDGWRGPGAYRGWHSLINLRLVGGEGLLQCSGLGRTRAGPLVLLSFNIIRLPKSYYNNILMRVVIKCTSII